MGEGGSKEGMVVRCWLNLFKNKNTQILAVILNREIVCVQFILTFLDIEEEVSVALTNFKAFCLLVCFYCHVC